MHHIRWWEIHHDFNNLWRQLCGGDDVFVGRCLWYSHNLRSIFILRRHADGRDTGPYPEICRAESADQPASLWLCFMHNPILQLTVLARGPLIHYISVLCFDEIRFAERIILLQLSVNKNKSQILYQLCLHIGYMFIDLKLSRVNKLPIQNQVHRCELILIWSHMEELVRGYHKRMTRTRSWSLLLPGNSGSIVVRSGYSLLW